MRDYGVNVRDKPSLSGKKKFSLKFQNMPYANIFGHVHANPIYKDFSEQSFCVSVERINYTPVSFDEIKRVIAEENAVKK